MAPKTQNGVKEKTSEVKDERVRLRCACGAVVIGRRGTRGKCPKCGKMLEVKRQEGAVALRPPIPVPSKAGAKDSVGLAPWFLPSLLVIVIGAYGAFRYNGIDLLSFLDASEGEIATAQADVEREGSNADLAPKGEELAPEAEDDTEVKEEVNPGEQRQQEAERRRQEAEEKQRQEEEQKRREEQGRREEELIRRAFAIDVDSLGAEHVQVLEEALKVSSLSKEERHQLESMQEYAVGSEMIVELTHLRRTRKEGDPRFREVAEEYAQRYPSYPGVFRLATQAAVEANDADLALELGRKFLHLCDEVRKSGGNPYTQAEDPENTGDVWFFMAVAYELKEEYSTALAFIKTAAKYNPSAYREFADDAERRLARYEAMRIAVGNLQLLARGASLLMEMNEEGRGEAPEVPAERTSRQPSAVAKGKKQVTYERIVEAQLYTVEGFFSTDKLLHDVRIEIERWYGALGPPRKFTPEGWRKISISPVRTDSLGKIRVNLRDTPGTTDTYRFRYGTKVHNFKVEEADKLRRKKVYLR